ncbi:hypothetical protein JCM31271_35640 [Halorubrum trueperi]
MLVLAVALVGVAAVSGSVGAATTGEFDGGAPDVESNATDDGSSGDDSETDDSSSGDDSETDDGSSGDDSETDDGSSEDDGSTGDNNSTDDGTDSGDDTDPARFEITSVETNTPTVIGETVTVTVEVTNTGDEAATNEISFSLDEYLKDEADVTLDAGESTIVDLSYVTKSGDAQDWTLAVETPDDTDTQTVTVEEPSRDSNDTDDGNDGDDGSDGSSSHGGGSTVSHGDPAFDIDAFDIDGPVKAGEPLRMNATVTNTGSADGERLLWFTLDDRTLNETVIELDRGEELNVSYVHETPVEGHGVWNLSAHTPDDQVDRSTEVLELHSNITIDAVETNGPVTAGETLNATVNVSNTGDIAGNQTVALYLDDQRMDARSVTLEPNESIAVTLAYRSNSWTTGELNLSAATGEDREAFVAVVEEETTETTDTPETPSDSSTSISDASTTDSSSDSSSATEDDGTTDDSTPGFGAVAALSALLATLAAARFRRDLME